MKLNFNKNQGFTVTAKLLALLACELAKVEKPVGSFYALTFNFRDPNYSAENGGYHPVEIRLEKHDDHWQFIYITDFSYRGGPYPDLVKDIDVCFETKRVYSLFGGWLNQCDAKELVKLFIANFVEYHEMNVYNTKIGFC
jgi:hypothetical protein